uniref:THAP4-like heme-binding beta-barrel domain-containing protein n=1 Tax=Globodera rostochiensis TaxID=31243 RepID=A0A914HKC0_GLORO
MDNQRQFANFCYLLILIIIIASICAISTNAELNQNNKKLSWIVGKWRSEFSGKVFWPSIPTMTFGEELVVAEAPLARTAGVQFLNWSARAWSHSTKDHFHDEWGYITVESNGNATLMTAGNNGFTTYEVGEVKSNKMVLTLKDIGRISFSRDLPVEDLRRTFIKHDDTYMEQVLEMRTATHPKVRDEMGIDPSQVNDGMGPLEYGTQKVHDGIRAHDETGINPSTGPREDGTQWILESNPISISTYLKPMEWWHMVDMKIEREAAWCARAKLTTTNADGTLTTYRNLADVPTPNGPIVFRKIQISFINNEVLTFLERIDRLFRQQIVLHMCIKAEHRCSSALIQLWALLSNSISSLKLDSPQTFIRLRQFHQDDVLQHCQHLQHLDVVDVIPSAHPRSSEKDKNNNALFIWLHTPLLGGRPKILQCKGETSAGQEEMTLDEFKWAFERVNFPASYLGLICLDEDNPDDLALERRPTAGLDEAQWKEWRKKAADSFHLEEATTNLIILELYDEQICSPDGSPNSED